MFSFFRSSRKSFRNKAIGRSKRLGFESLEVRSMMAAGGILYDAAHGRITIEGTDLYDDTAYVSYDNRGTPSILDDGIRVELKNTGASLVQQFPLVKKAARGSGSSASIVEIVFNGYSGNDFVDNNTSIKLRAYGGNGNDVLLGGSADDALLGGAGHDYIDGRLGGDMIWGEAGSDALFGDAGIDILVGNDGNDYLHGGDGNDSLYGDAGDDWLFGGAGVDTLSDNSGSNTLNSDYGVTNAIVNGYETFDWFDRNLQDATVRSLARLRYRDASLGRNDMLEIYGAVSKDNVVVANEFNDLGDLTNANLTMWDGVRSLASNVINGDRANQWYQGGTLGNLAAGASGNHLEKLVDKWFKGGDLPAIAPEAWYVEVRGSLFRNGISYTDVDQGSGANDCYFLAGLAETAQHSPQTILNMFFDNGDGTFTVGFFRGSSMEFVTVNRSLPMVLNVGTAQYAGWGGGVFNDTTNELWVALAEKAYAQLNESGWIEQDGTNSYAGIGYGYSALAFSHITGETATERSLQGSSMMNTVINAQNAGLAITFDSKDEGVDPGISDNHVYTLESYDAATQRFKLFNPHNDANGTYPTYVYLTWSEILHNFEQWTSVDV